MALVNIYVRLVREGYRRLDEVPSSIKDEVEKKINS